MSKKRSLPKPTPPNPESRVMMVYAPPADADRVMALRKAHKISISTLLCMVLKEGLPVIERRLNGVG